MLRTLTITAERWPIRGGFRIARGSKQEAEVVLAEISERGMTGRGECVPYKRYGETVDSVVSELEAAASDISEGMDRAALQSRMKAGAARNALDCALIDLEAKTRGIPAHTLLGLAARRLSGADA